MVDVTQNQNNLTILLFDLIRDIIQRHMPQLKSITLGDRCALDPEELRGIADGKELEDISIEPHTYASSNTLDEVLSTIISKSPRLKRFSVVNYHPDQRVVVELCKMSDLIDLRIWGHQLTKENFVAFSQQVFAEKLQVLHLGHIGQGVETGLIEFIGKAHQLRELEVYGGNVTDRLLECLGDSCPDLEIFDATRADGITLDGVQMLADRCSKLRRLAVDNTACTFASSLKDLKLDRYRKLEFC